MVEALTARIDVDVCIVGGGAAGLTVAAHLAHAGREVLLLERGPRRRGPRRRDHENFEGEGPVVDRRSRRIGLGGDGWMWSRSVVEFEPLDFEETAWRPGWPFDKSELEPFYDLARDDLQVGRSRPAQPLGPGIALQPIDRSPRRFREPPAGVDVRLGARVTNIEVHDGRVERLIVVDRGGGVFHVSPTVCVLAAGGLETPLLLQGSGIGGDEVGRFFSDHPYLTIPLELPEGAPTIDDVVGRDLCAPPQALLTLPEELRRTAGLPGAAVFFVPYRDHALWGHPGVRSWQEWTWARRNREFPPAPVSLAARSLRATVPIVRALRQRNRGWSNPAVRLVVEPIPSRDGRVSAASTPDRLGGKVPHVTWPLGTLEKGAIDRLLGELSDHATSRGWGPLRLPEGTGWPDRVFSGAHHMGATRMASDPSQGVVDPDCQVFGVENLFVAGPSVFPTFGYANPMLTTVALAIRLARHVAR